MSPTEIIIIVLSVVLLAIVLYFIFSKREKKEELDTEDFINCFSEIHIKKIEYIRNKIVITFQNIKDFDSTKLQHVGGTSISIVGDKVKFIMSDNPEINKAYYHALLNHIEG